MHLAAKRAAQSDTSIYGAAVDAIGGKRADKAIAIRPKAPRSTKRSPSTAGSRPKRQYADL